VFMGLNLL